MALPHRVGMSYTLTRDGLDELLAAIRRQGFRLVGPVVADGAICYGDISSSADLPAGWTEEQDAGTYRIHPRPACRRLHSVPRGTAGPRRPAACSTTVT